MRYPPVGPASRRTPCGSIGDAANTGSPAIPNMRYRIWLAEPRRDPSAAAPTSTTIGWNVNGTGVNGSGMLICAAIAVSTATNTTAPVCSAAGTRTSTRVVNASKNVGYMDANVTRMRTALTIAGSDSSAGAGIQADLKTFAAFGLYGTSAITAVTVQSTKGVEAVAPLSADLVSAQ